MKKKYGKRGVRQRRKFLERGSRYYKQELAGVILMALFLFLTISFFSYNPTDNSWFYFSSDPRPIANWCGALGAYISAFFFFLLGGASYVLLVALFSFAFLLLRTIASWRAEAVRLCALPTLIVASSFLFRLHREHFVVYESGGVVGRLVDGALSTFFGEIGTALLAYAVLWASILLFARVSFVRFTTVFCTAALTTTYFVAQKAFIGFKYFSVGFYKVSRVVGRVLAVASAALFDLLRRWRERRRLNSVYGKENERVSAPVHQAEMFDELSRLARQARGGVASVGELRSSIANQTKLNDSVDEIKPFEPPQIPEVRLKADGGRMRNTALGGGVFEGDCFLALLQKIVEAKIAIAQEQGFDPQVSYELPDFARFQEVREEQVSRDEFEEICKERGRCLEEKLERFGVKGKVTAIRPGPVVTLFEYKPDIDSKISKIVSLEDDLAMALTALSIRIIAPIPGRNVIGFEISNQTRKDVYLSDVIKGGDASSVSLPLAFGADITGNSVVYDLVSMPHILVAGSTGSGKSVGLNSMLVSLLCRRTPEELKLILIDPKRLEFAPYADIPHLLFPIVTNPRKAIPVLKWVVQEMEDRYDLMAKVGVRNILDYQKLYKESLHNPSMRHMTAAYRAAGSSAGAGAGASSMSLEPMPFIVLIIDELADLMMVAGKDVETQIARTAQMARAAGIHMIVATQRPSVDVLTGLIKVNFPARMAFRVSSKIDSRTILDSPGAEKLLGRGDMLFLDSRSSAPERIHGAYVSGREIAGLTDYLRMQQEVSYLDINEALRKNSSIDGKEFEDELYDDIKAFVKTIDEISISLLQRRYRIGFNRSARIIEKLELDGLIAPNQGGKMRKVIH